MKFRFVILLSVLALIYGTLIFRLYAIQIRQGEDYARKIEQRDKFIQGEAVRRGAIYFSDRSRNGIPVAVNKKFPVIYAVPQEIKEPKKTADSLAALVGWQKNKLTAALSKPGDLYENLLEKASSEQIRLIREGNFNGVYVEERNFRYYPFQDLASHLLGLVGFNQNNSQPLGLYGLENFYESELKNGRDIYLTIDINLQTRAEEILENLIKKFEASAGAVIIQKSDSGEILTLVSKPDFNSNNYSQFAVGLFLNPVAQSLYEPGSVLKVLTIAAGLDSKKFTPQTTFYDVGKIVLNGRTVENWDKKAYGQATVANILEYSINTGAVWAEQTVGHNLFYDYLTKFGLGEITGIDLPYERAGNLENLRKKKARDIDFATASFGQGVAVTPLELINGFSAVVNGGSLMRPYLNIETKPRVLRRVISAETSRQLKEMMVSALEKVGIAIIPDYQLGGKTGTAQVPDAKNGGYSSEVINTYIGFVPAAESQFVILLKLDKPKNAPLAGLTVVPAFKELAQFVLNYYQIAPRR